MRQPLLIVALAVAAACGYGILHDLVTAHLCVEYFTIGHPPVFPTSDPVLLALGWGVLATWWVGLPLGIALACCARLGPGPQRGAGELLRPIGVLLLAMAACALLAGAVGHVAARSGAVFLTGRIAGRVPAEQHVWFLTALWMHLASYLAGGVGGIVLCAVTVVRRRRERKGSMGSKSPSSTSGRSG